MWVNALAEMLMGKGHGHTLASPALDLWHFLPFPTAPAPAQRIAVKSLSLYSKQNLGTNRAVSTALDVQYVHELNDMVKLEHGVDKRQKMI